MRLKPASEWQWLLDEEAPRQQTSMHVGSVFALANGVLGVRGLCAELAQGHSAFLASAFVRKPLEHHERFPGYPDFSETRLTCPGVSAIRVAIDEQEVDFAAASILKREISFDLRDASVNGRTIWVLDRGRELLIETKQFVPLERGAVFAQRIAVTPLNFTGEIYVEAVVEAESPRAQDANDPRNSARAAFVPIQASDGEEGYLVRFSTTPTSPLTLSVSQRLEVHSPERAAQGHRSVRAVRLQGQALVFDRLVELEVTAPQSANDAGSLGTSSIQSLPGFDILQEHHAALVEKFWDAALVEMPDDPALTLALRFNILQTFLSASRTGAVGTAAKGLSGEGYEGHCFWDTEVFLQPVLALTCPALAKSALEYRISGLDRARKNAREIGHARGALYPWRTISGSECSTHYPTGSAQYHINGAIAYALEVYVHATGDLSVLSRGGLEVLIETARLWFDLGHFSDRRGGAFLIHGVTGPDEYTALVDNDFYTNAMARRHLLFAAAMSEKLLLRDQDAMDDMVDRLQFSASEIADWRRAADLMWLPIDRDLKVHPQDDTFLSKPKFEGMEQGGKPLLMRVHPMVLFRHQICKQGDVVQAHMTAGLEASLTQIGRDLAFYEPLTTHDSTLSMTAFAVCGAKIGKEQSSFDYWRQTALVDIENLHGNTDHGLHMAAAAGSWLVLAMGWAGLDLQDECLRLAPRCPESWSGYSLRLCWHGRIIAIAVSPQSTTYRLIAGDPLAILDRGREVELRGEPQTVEHPAIEAVIFDLDGVLTDTAEKHFHAWKRLADEEGFAFDKAFNESLKGVSRTESLRRILAHAEAEVDEASFERMLVRKNQYYIDSITDFSPADVFPGVSSLLRDCRRAGLKIGLASASRNAATLVARMGLEPWFDHITDSSQIVRGKPDPEIFLETARALGVAPEKCVGIEDASAGIAAIRDAGMTSFGVGDSENLSQADRIFSEVGSIRLQDILQVRGR